MWKTNILVINMNYFENIIINESSEKLDIGGKRKAFREYSFEEREGTCLVFLVGFSSSLKQEDWIQL